MLNSKASLPPKNRLIRLALPIITGSLLQLAYNITDMFWVGRVGSSAVAAVGTAGFYMNLAWALLTLLLTGVNVLVPQSVGAGDKTKINRVASTAFWGISILAVAVTAVLCWGKQPLIGFFKFNDPAVEEQAQQYLYIVAFSVVLQYLNLFFASLINAHGKTKTTLKINSLGILTNIILDPLLITSYGMGVKGAAYATVIARAVVFVRYLYLLQKQQDIKIWKVRPDFKLIRPIIKLGSPIALQRLTFTGIQIIMAKLLAEWGAKAVAAQQIGLSMEALSFMTMAGLSQAMTIQTGQDYGGQHYKLIPKTYREGITFATIIGLSITALFWLLPQQLMGFFLKDPQTIALGTIYLYILGASQVFMCWEMVTVGAFNGLGKTQIPPIVSIICTGARIPLALLLAHQLDCGVEGIWAAVTVSSIAKGVILPNLFLWTLYQFKKHSFSFSKSI